MPEIYFSHQLKTWKLKYYDSTYGGSILVTLYDDKQQELKDQTPKTKDAAARAAEQYLDYIGENWRNVQH